MFWRRNQNLGSKTVRGRAQAGREEPKERPQEGRKEARVGTLRGNGREERRGGGKRGTMTASRLPNPTAKKKKLVGLPHRIATAEREQRERGGRLTGKEEESDSEERNERGEGRRRRILIPPSLSLCVAISVSTIAIDRAVPYLASPFLQFRQQGPLLTT